MYNVQKCTTIKFIVDAGVFVKTNILMHLKMFMCCSSILT